MNALEERNIFTAERTADEFFKIIEFLSVSTDIEIRFGTPALVNAAFLAELSIKTMLLKDARPIKRSHDLWKLFLSLPSEEALETKNILTKEWPNFDEELAKAKLAFVGWRYLFQQESELLVNIKFVSDFAKACYQIMKKKHPIFNRTTI